MSNYMWVYTTLPDKAKAMEISKTLVKEKLIARSNILENMTSIYEWKGEVCEESEVSMIMKTTKEKLKVLEKKIIELHPYECPAILYIPIEGGNDDFFDWIKKQVSS